MPTLTGINYRLSIQSSVKSLLEGVSDPMFMAPHVTFPAPSPVNIAHVTYTVELVRSANLGCMVVTVTCLVPSIVKTTDVTERMEHVLHVKPDGQGNAVKQNVQMDGTVSTVASNAQDIVETTRPVIT